MSGMDQWMGKAREMANAAGKMAGEALDASKTKVQELKLSGDLKDAYARLGTVVYDARRGGVDNEKLVDLILGEIETLRKELKALNPQQEAESRELYCPQCGAANDPEDLFCPKCGAPLSKQAPVE